MPRGDPERIRQAQRAGTIARLASARNVDHDRAASILAAMEAMEAELAAAGIERESPEWQRELDRRISRT